MMPQGYPGASQRVKVTPAVIMNSSRYKYNRNGTKTATGRAAVDNGDALAEALRGQTLDQILQDVADNGQEVPGRWLELNNGMRRMVASNVLRGVLRREGRVKVAGRWVQLEK